MFTQSFNTLGHKPAQLGLVAYWSAIETSGMDRVPSNRVGVREGWDG